MAARGYYLHTGEVVGPLSPTDFREHCASGRITLWTPVRQGESGEWIPACRVQGLADLLVKGPAVPPPLPGRAGTAELAGDGAEAGPALLDDRQFLARMFGSRGGWLASLVFHAVLLLVFSLVVVAPHAAEDLWLNATVSDLEPAEPALAVEDQEEVDAIVPMPAPLETEDQQSGEAAEPREVEPDEVSERGEGVGRGDAGDGSGADLEEFSSRLARAGARTGDVQVSLIWHNFNDLDLHVRCPSGEEISYSRRQSSCGGRLDVDMNAGGRHSDTPVENIFWPQGGAPAGRYQVFVNHYANRGSRDPTDFQVAVKVGGEIQVFRGSLSRGQPNLLIDEFEWTRDRTVVRHERPGAERRNRRQANREQLAGEQLEQARRMLETNPVAGRRRLEIVRERFPETEAAAEAGRLLQGLPSE